MSGRERSFTCPGELLVPHRVCTERKQVPSGRGRATQDTQTAALGFGDLWPQHSIYAPSPKSLMRFQVGGGAVAAGAGNGGVLRLTSCLECRGSSGCSPVGWRCPCGQQTATEGVSDPGPTSPLTEGVLRFSRRLFFTGRRRRCTELQLGHPGTVAPSVTGVLPLQDGSWELDKWLLVVAPGTTGSDNAASTREQGSGNKINKRAAHLSRLGPASRRGRMSVIYTLARNCAKIIFFSGIFAIPTLSECGMEGFVLREKNFWHP